MPTGRDVDAPRLTGIVLAGGVSTRLGEPKPLVVVGGRTVLARIVAALRPVCAEIILAVSPGQSDATPETGLGLGMHVVLDRYPQAGPLAGLEVGLAAAAHGLAFLVAADHPFLSGALVRAMAAEASGAGYDAVVLAAGGRLQPLHGVYAPDVWAPLLRRALDRGERSLYKMLRGGQKTGAPRVRVFDEPDALRHDPDARSLFDIDTPDRLAKARRIASGAPGA